MLAPVELQDARRSASCRRGDHAQAAAGQGLRADGAAVRQDGAAPAGCDAGVGGKPRQRRRQPHLLLRRQLVVVVADVAVARGGVAAEIVNQPRYVDDHVDIKQSSRGVFSLSALKRYARLLQILALKPDAMAPMSLGHAEKSRSVACILRRFGYCALGGLAGLLITYGWWGWKLYHRLGNPVWLSNRSFKSYDDLVDHCCDAPVSRRNV
jgi:hypothetical protein